ncbi:MAG: efflux RND transporter periplasmic adaptor subunit [Bacteroidales bacterium]
MKTSRYYPYALVLMFVVSCNTNNTPVPKDLPPLSIGVEEVARMDIADSIQIFGMVKLRQEAFLASQFDGRLTGFSLIRGDRVEEGQQIGTIVPPEREALNQTSAAMNEELQQIMEHEIREIPLYSPIHGTVLEVKQNNGDVVQKGESIVHIADLGNLDIYGDLPVIYLPQVKQLKSLRILFVDYPHRPLILPISAVDGQVDMQKQTIQIRLALDNPRDEYRPGMMVKLEFPDQVHRGALVISRSALLEEEGVYSVFVVHDHQVEKRDVQIGIKHDDYVEVISGLTEGDVVANEKAYSLTDGMKVQIQ